MTTLTHVRVPVLGGPHHGMTVAVSSGSQQWRLVRFKRQAVQVQVVSEGDKVDPVTAATYVDVYDVVEIGAAPQDAAPVKMKALIRSQDKDDAAALLLAFFMERWHTEA